MRTVFMLLIAFGVTFVALLPARADDKEEKERRERIEKQLAELEPRLEKEEWAVKCKQTIAEFMKELTNAERIDLFRINPRELPEENKEKKKEFHGYEILAEARVASDEKRKEVATFLGKTLHWSELRKASCFNPRHGLRAVSGKRTWDFLICFECNRVRVFEGGETLAELPLAFVEGKNPIEQFLQGSDKKTSDGK
jgi:hypothetical protein